MSSAPNSSAAVAMSTAASRAVSTTIGSSRRLSLHRLDDLQRVRVIGLLIDDDEISDERVGPGVRTSAEAVDARPRRARRRRRHLLEQAPDEQVETDIEDAQPALPFAGIAMRALTDAAERVAQVEQGQVPSKPGHRQRQPPPPRQTSALGLGDDGNDRERDAVPAEVADERDRSVARHLRRNHHGLEACAFPDLGQGLVGSRRLPTGNARVGRLELANQGFVDVPRGTGQKENCIGAGFPTCTGAITPYQALSNRCINSGAECGIRAVTWIIESVQSSPVVSSATAVAGKGGGPW